MPLRTFLGRQREAQALREAITDPDGMQEAKTPLIPVTFQLRLLIKACRLLPSCPGKREGYSSWRRRGLRDRGAGRHRQRRMSRSWIKSQEWNVWKLQVLNQIHCWLKAVAPSMKRPVSLLCSKCKNPITPRRLMLRAYRVLYPSALLGGVIPSVPHFWHPSQAAEWCLLPCGHGLCNTPAGSRQQAAPPPPYHPPPTLNTLHIYAPHTTSSWIPALGSLEGGT